MSQKILIYGFALTMKNFHIFVVVTLTGLKMRQTLFAVGKVGTVICNELLGKTPFSTSLMAAFITGKQTETASLK